MNKDKEFVKEIKIDKKRRFRYNFITLIIFNAIFLCSLIYMFALIHNAIAGAIAVLLFALSVFGSVRTIVKSRNSRKYVVYRDKLTIQSTSFDGEIDLSKVFMVKAKRNIFDIIFRKSAHMLVVYVRHKTKEVYMLPFIGENVELLADDIMKLAIQAREGAKQNAIELNSLTTDSIKKQDKGLIKKEINRKKTTKK